MHKILLVAHWDWVLYNFRLSLAKALQEHGCEVVFVCPFGDYVAKLRSEGFRCIHWHVNRRSLNPFQEAGAVTRLTRIYRGVMPDVVHHFTIKPNLYGTISARLAKVPAVINTFTGLGYLFSNNYQARLLRVLISPVLRRVLHMPKSVTVFQNEPDRQTFIRMRLISPEQTAVIAGSGVDVHRFAPGGRRIISQEAQKPVVFMASRLLKDKGIEEFVEASRRLRAKGVEAQFWVAGEQDKGNPACIADKVLSAWREEAVVDFLGHRSDMPELLQRADMAVLPSYHEGVPRFLLEAAATGLPLIATDIEGCKMVVQNEVNGLLVPPRDVNSLTQAIERLLCDEGLRRRMGQAGRKIAETIFSEEKIIEQYLDLYRCFKVID
jgi:glycosyltransferase involved in cell wall biosynthesis